MAAAGRHSLWVCLSASKCERHLEAPAQVLKIGLDRSAGAEERPGAARPLIPVAVGAEHVEGAVEPEHL